MECPICLDNLDDSVAFVCRHSCCRRCLQESGITTCPLCSCPIQNTTPTPWLDCNSENLDCNSENIRSEELSDSENLKFHFSDPRGHILAEIAKELLKTVEPIVTNEVLILENKAKNILEVEERYAIKLIQLQEQKKQELEEIESEVQRLLDIDASEVKCQEYYNQGLEHLAKTCMALSTQQAQVLDQAIPFYQPQIDDMLFKWPLGITQHRPTDISNLPNRNLSSRYNSNSSKQSSSSSSEQSSSSSSEQSSSSSSKQSSKQSSEDISLFGSASAWPNYVYEKRELPSLFIYVEEVNDFLYVIGDTVYLGNNNEVFYGIRQIKVYGKIIYLMIQETLYMYNLNLKPLKIVGQKQYFRWGETLLGFYVDNEEISYVSHNYENSTYVTQFRGHKYEIDSEHSTYKNRKFVDSYVVGDSLYLETSHWICHFRQGEVRKVELCANGVFVLERHLCLYTYEDNQTTKLTFITPETDDIVKYKVSGRGTFYRGAKDTILQVEETMAKLI